MNWMRRQWQRLFRSITCYEKIVTVNGRVLSGKEADRVDREITAFFDRSTADMQRTMDRIFRNNK